MQGRSLFVLFLAMGTAPLRHRVCAPDPAVIAWLDCQRPAHPYLSAVVVAEIDTGIAL